MDRQKTPEEILGELRANWLKASRNLTTVIHDKITSGSLATSDEPVVMHAITSWRAYNDARRVMGESKNAEPASTPKSPTMFEEAAKLGVQLRPDGSVDRIPV